MKTLKRMVKFSLAYAVVVVGSMIPLLGLAEGGLAGAPLLIAYMIAIALIMIAFGRYYWRRGDKSIWHIPASQALLHGGSCLFLYGRDWLGFRQTSGFMDFGVGFEIVIFALLGVTWIAPSLVIAILYSVMAYQPEAKEPNAEDPGGESLE